MPIGKWFACFSVEVENQPLSPWTDGPAAGIDVGLESFATISYGEKTEDPRFFRSEEKELERVQGMLSKTPKGSSERMKALNVVERAHEWIANHRSDFVNKVSQDLVNHFRVIEFEDLNIKNMLKNHILAKAISDVALGMLVTTIESKAAYSGSVVVLVDPRKTSQMCSREELAMADFRHKAYTRQGPNN